MTEPTDPDLPEPEPTEREPIEPEPIASDSIESEPIEARDGSEQDRLAQTGPTRRRREADAGEVASEASTSMAGSDDASDDAGAAAAPDDPEQASGQVAAALAELDAAAEWPPADQVAAFTAAHETLQATLARIDDH